MFGLNSRQLFTLLILAIVVFALWRIVPVYFQRFQFADTVNEEVKFAASKKNTARKVRAVILEEAMAAKIPITADSVHITRRGPTFTVEIDYKLPVDFYVYEYEWPAHIEASGEMFQDDRN